MTNKKLAPIEVKDLLTYRYPENLQYSPSGKYLAFHVARPVEKENGYRRDVWMVENGKCKQLTQSLDASILVWKDDTTLLLRRNTEEKEEGCTELFELSLLGGEAKPIGKVPVIIQRMKKLEDGLYALIANIDANDPDAYKDTEDVRKKKLEEKKLEEDYHVVDEIPYWFNGKGYLNKIRTALFLLNLKEEKPVLKRISDAYQNVSSFDQLGNTIYYIGETHKLRKGHFNRIYSHNYKTNKKETILGKDIYSIDEVFVFNKKVYVRATDMKECGMGQTPDIMLVKKDTLEKVIDPHRSLYCATAGDTMLGGGKRHVALEDGWLTLATDVDHTVIWKFDKNFKKKVLFDQLGAIYFMDACKDKVAFAFEDANGPTEIYEMDKNGKSVKKLTNLNTEAVKGKYVAKPNPIDYQSEGWNLRGWVLLPKDYNPKKKYPAVLDVHGGPRGIYSPIFVHEMQVWASKGYFVYFGNIVGSDGRDDEFADLRGHYGDTDYKNLMDFTDVVLKKYPAIDKKRLCVTGGSYGGFMTNWIIGHTDRFCCAASQRSIASWISMTFIADIGPWFDQNECGIPYNESVLKHFDKLWEYSPLKYIEGAKTPTLFIHSEEDYRCPLPEGMQMMQSLAYQNVETRLVIFKGENHELSRSGKPLHRLRRLNEITNWFEKHTKKGK